MRVEGNKFSVASGAPFKWSCMKFLFKYLSVTYTEQKIDYACISVTGIKRYKTTYRRSVVSLVLSLIFHPAIYMASDIAYGGNTFSTTSGSSRWVNN